MIEKIKYNSEYYAENKSIEYFLYILGRNDQGNLIVSIEEWGVYDFYGCHYYLFTEQSLLHFLNERNFKEHGERILIEDMTNYGEGK